MSEHAPLTRQAVFRFSEELNDFLPRGNRHRALTYRFTGTPSVKDTIEAIGVPHPEVDVVLIDGRPSMFDRLLFGGEEVDVYPRSPDPHLEVTYRHRAEPLEPPRFILDVHLGKLARHLRMVGFDALYRNDYDDLTIVEIATGSEERTILTRDLGILRHGRVKHGYWLRETNPERQLREVVQAFRLTDRLRPFTRCLECNTCLEEVSKTDVYDRLPEGVRDAYDVFSWCPGCGRVYWAGSHYNRMKGIIDTLQLPARGT